MSGFRIQARHFFLTYPRCTVTKEQALQQLKTAFPVARSIKVAQEHHEDGTPHLHAVVTCSRKYDCRARDRLHLKGEDGTVFQGDYQAVKNINAVNNYIAKDDTPLVWQTEEEEEPETITLLEQSANKEEFLLNCITKRTKHAERCFLNLERMAEIYFKTPVQVYTPPYTPESFCVPDALTDWVRENLTAGMDAPSHVRLMDRV